MRLPAQRLVVNLFLIESSERFYLKKSKNAILKFIFHVIRHPQNRENHEAVLLARYIVIECACGSFSLINYQSYVLYFCLLLWIHALQFNTGTLPDSQRSAVTRLTCAQRQLAFYLKQNWCDKYAFFNDFNQIVKNEMREKGDWISQMVGTFPFTMPLVCSIATLRGTQHWFLGVWTSDSFSWLLEYPSVKFLTWFLCV